MNVLEACQDALVTCPVSDNVANRRVPNPVDTNGATACEVRNCQLSGQRMRCPDPAKVYPWDALRPLAPTSNAIDHPKNLVDTSDAMRRSAVSGELGGRLEPTHKASLLLRHPRSNTSRDYYLYPRLADTFSEVQRHQPMCPTDPRESADASKAPREPPCGPVGIDMPCALSVQM